MSSSWGFAREPMESPSHEVLLLERGLLPLRSDHLVLQHLLPGASIFGTFSKRISESLGLSLVYCRTNLPF